MPENSHIPAVNPLLRGPSPAPFVPPTLEPHQVFAKNALLSHPRMALWLDMGLGKTLTTLDALHTLGLGVNEPVLVIAPPAVAKSTWGDEIDKWGYPIPYQSLLLRDDGSPAQRLDRMELYEEAFFGPPKLWTISNQLVPDLVNYTDNVGFWPFPTLVIDEAQNFKNHAAERFKSLVQIMPQTRRTIELTGTPAPNGLTDLWAQMYLLDKGRALGHNITAFRERYCRQITDKDGNHMGFVVASETSEREIQRAVTHLALSMKNTSIQLPPITVNDIRLSLNDKERAIYKAMAQAKVIELSTFDGCTATVSAANAGVLSIRLLQMASGIAYPDEISVTNGDPDDPDDDTSTQPATPGTKPKKSSKREYLVIHQRKLDELEHILENSDSPVLIVYGIAVDKKRIPEEMKKRGHAVHVFDGSPKMVREWNQKKYPAMLIHPATAGAGMNFQHGGHTIIWYTLTYSSAEYEQTNARVYRKGQTEPVIIHRLIARGTRDADMPGILAGKAQTQNDLLESARHDVAAAYGISVNDVSLTGDVETDPDD